MDSVRDWAGLVTDLLEKIATRIVIIEDFKAFRGVCTSWRSAASKDKYFNGMVDGKIPYLLLPEEADGNRKLYSLFERRILGEVAILEEAKGKPSFDVGFGWILAVDYQDGYAMLCKSLSRAKAIQLPNIKGVCGQSLIHQAILSDNPASDNFALILLTTDNIYSWRKGDMFWILIKSPPRVRRSIRCTSICCLNHKIFYALEYNGCIWTWNLSTFQLWLFQVLNVGAENPMDDEVWLKHLVESTTGELLLINRTEDKFDVIVIDVEREKCQRRNDLRGDAIFLSRNCPTSVAAAAYPAVLKPNSIYYANDYLGSLIPSPYAGDDMRAYNIADKSFESFNFEGSVGRPSKISSPLWISPSF